MASPKRSISRDPITIDQCGVGNQAGLVQADVDKLKAGTTSAAAMKWLYPYESTVFPRGMLAPDLMWDGPAADVVFVHIKSMIFEYWGCLAPTERGRITLDQGAWDNAGERSFGKDDVFTVELTALSQGAVVGKATSHILIAQAAIKGSIYYNTYSSRLVGGAPPAGGMDPGLGLPLGGGLGGVVLKIPAGGRAEVFGQTDCNGCHSVSADGSRLIAQSVAGGAYSYQLSTNGPAAAPMMPAGTGSWVAIYPDGSAFLTMSTAIDVARASLFGAAGGSPNATLYDATSGATLPSVGIPSGALMPFFSPDGKFLVFNDYALGEAHGIALMQYNTATHTASNYDMLYMEPDAAMQPGWPFVLPDNHAVVFIRTTQADFTGGGAGVAGFMPEGVVPPFAELNIVDVASKKVTVLAKTMGFNTPEDAANNTTYLPFGEADLHHAYYPTVSPVGAGGYFWVFFDSVRNYGVLGVQRQLWGAAIDISADGSYTYDPSHPPFYLSGQEYGTGNHRAFAALDPCHKDGDACTSGIDCCGGYCYVDQAQELAEPTGTCSPKMMECAKRDERCVSDHDCCAPESGGLPNSCIAGYCTFVRGPD
jgi:hypothetical protein